jgi:hypothetical protein
MMRRKIKNGVPILKVRKGARLREIYAKLRKEFTAAYLLRYALLEEGIPAEQVIAEMERIQEEEERKLENRRKRKT